MHTSKRTLVLARRISVVQTRHITDPGISRRAAAVTVALDPSRGTTQELQHAAIDRVQDSLSLGKRRTQSTAAHQHQNAAVVLVSRSLAPWLHDDAFMSRILAATGIGNLPKAGTVTMAAAAVDEVPRYDRRSDSFASSEGISVLRGPATYLFPELGLFPGFRGGEAKQDNPSAHRASLEFRPPPTRHMASLSVNVPLANTLFTNGSPHILIKSTWRTHMSHFPYLVGKEQHTNMAIHLPEPMLDFAKDSSSTVASFLVPITLPRKVLQSLGNIVSQVEIDGQPAPASQELETIVPPLLEQHRKLLDGPGQGEDHPPAGPVGVWALTMPHDYRERGLGALWPLDTPYHPRDEFRRAKLTARLTDMYISRGCRWHKVLSGGGGWGQKRGLLSLDPQTKLETDEDQDLEHFMDSFQGKNEAAAGGNGSGGGGGGIVSPGTYVQFFVEPPYPPRDIWATNYVRRLDPSDWNTPTAVFGTPGTPVGVSPMDAVRSFRGLFGAVSAEGVYLHGAAKKKKTGGAEEGEADAVATKMDAPNSYVISTSRVVKMPQAQKKGRKEGRGEEGGGEEGLDG